MNKDLKDRIFNIPDDVLQHLKYQMVNKNGDIEGIKRARNLVNTGTVTYGQLKRIIHDIKNINKNIDFEKFNLYGGEVMERWAKSTLDGERNLIKGRKQSKKRSDNISSITGERTNAFLSSHTKKTSFLPPTNLMKSNSDKNSISSLKLSKIFEEIINK